MQIDDQEKKNIAEVMQEVDSEKESRSRKEQRATRLENEIRRMHKQARSIERSGDAKRIGNYNRIFIAKVTELSVIRQTTGQTKRQDSAEIVKQILAQ